MFGVAGMAGRKTFTYVVIGTGTGDVIFEADRPISTWKSVAHEMITDVPNLAGKLYVNGELVGAVSTGGQEDLVSQIARVSELHGAGVLSDEEFAQVKQRLLGGHA